MSILDTFYILFKTDAADVEKGAKKAKAVVDGLEDSIGGADKVTVLLGKKFNTLATQAVAAFAGIFSVNRALAKFHAATEQGAKLGVLSEFLDADAAEIVNWSRAVAGYGGDINAFQSSIRGFSAAINSSLVNAPNSVVIALSKLGVAARNSKNEVRPLLDLLPEIAARLSKKIPRVALGLGADLGFDTASTLFLMQGREAVAAAVARERELNLISKEDIAELRRLRAQRLGLQNILSDVATETLLFSVETLQKPAARKSIQEARRLQGEFFKSLGTGGMELFGAGIRGLGDFFKRPDVNLFMTTFPPYDFDTLKSSEDDVSAVDIESIGSLRNAIASMAATPLSAVSAYTSIGGVSQRSNLVTVGEVNIATQATDSEAIAAEISNELENQLSHAVEQSDDGVAG